MSGEIMIFPDTVEEFMNRYKIVDTEEVYTNRAEMVPIFRMMQWFEHQEAKRSEPCVDTISRQMAIDALENEVRLIDGYYIMDDEVIDKDDAIEAIRLLPAIQSERKKGKWILVKGSNGKDYHKCSECLHIQDITGVKNYCPVCGADMVGEQE